MATIVQLTDLHTVRYRQKRYDDDFAVLTREFRVKIPANDQVDYDRVITVPAGFAFGPSIPKRLRGFVSVTDCLEASCIHDWAYRMGCLTRLEADLVFRAMVKASAGAWRARRAYWAVRLGGASSYMPGGLDHLEGEEVKEA